MVTVIVWAKIYSLSEPNFRISFYESYHESSDFAECRYFTKLNGHISVVRETTVTWLDMLVVDTGIVHGDMTLTRFKVKIEVTGLLNFRKLPKPRMLAAMTVSPLAGLSALEDRLNRLKYRYSCSASRIFVSESGTILVITVKIGNVTRQRESKTLTLHIWPYNAPFLRYGEILDENRRF